MTSEKTEFARIVPLSIQEKLAELVIDAVRDDIEAIFAHGESDAANKAYRAATFRGRVMNIAMTSLFTDSVNEVTHTSARPTDSDEDRQCHCSPGSQDIGRQGDLSLRRCGHHKFSAGNYAGRPVHQLLLLLKGVADKYMDNRDFEWYCEQSGLIDAATQIAYKQGRY